MSDPEHRIDERILFRTKGIFIKSIPFEGILTNKRIILTDKTAILLPPREIPLFILRNTEAAEDAIGDPIIRLTIQTGTSETRQIILTFSCQTPGTGIKERDAWLRILKENTSSSFPGQVIHNVIPAQEEASKNPDYIIRIEVLRPPMLKSITGVIDPAVKKEVTWTPSTEWIIESPPTSPSHAITKVYDGSPSGFGISSPPEKEFNNLIFGVMFLILIIISTMLISISSTLYAQNPLESIVPTQISSSTSVAVSPNPDPHNSINNPVPADSMINLIPTNVPPGNSGEALPDADLVVTEAGNPPVTETISSYVTIEPKAFPDLESHVLLQPAIAQKYVEGYVTIYSLTHQNVSQVLPLVSFTLRNPPLVIDYNVTPQNTVKIKHIEYKTLMTEYEEDLEINRPYENTWFRIIVRNKDTGEIISEDGIGRTYSLQTPKQLVLRGYGNYSFEFTGDYATLDLTMKVKPEGNFP